MNQKKRNKCCALRHAYGILENDESISAEEERGDVEDGLVGVGQREGGMNESSVDVYTAS